MKTIFCISLLLFPLAALAEPQAPDAAQVLRDIQPLPELPAARTLNLILPPDSPETVPGVDDSGDTMTVSGFRFSGNRVFSTAELQAQLTDINNTELTFGDLEAAAARITRYYRDQGYPLARVFIPAQTIRDGVVAMTVLEGRLGDVQVNNQSRLGRWAQAPLKNLPAGQALRADVLERSLLLLNERAGASSQALLRPGTDTGLTDLLVTLDSQPLLNGSITLDNTGNRFTGADRALLSLSVNSPLGLGERFDLRLLGSDADQQYYYGGLQLPLGRHGTSIGAGYSWLTYTLGEDFSYLDSHGSASASHVFISQPLIARRALWLDVRLQHERRQLQDDIDLFSNRSKKRYQVTSLTLEGNSRDRWLGGGMNAFALSWGHGNLTMQSAEDRNSDDLSGQVRGGFNVVRPIAVRMQRLSNRISLFSRLRAQWADGNLGGGEKFSLGGSDGVRAYPQGEAQGDLGWLANIELRYNLTPAWQLATLLDYGSIKVNKERWDSSDNYRHLSSTGLSAGWRFHGFSADLSASWKVGSEDAESDKEDSPRIWLQAGWAF